MSEAGFTKGPWHAPGLFEVHDADHNIVADCNPHLNNEEPAFTTEEGEANARLIAASPLMFGMLQYVRAYLQERSDWPGTDALIGDLDSAIAKATGAAA